MDSRQIQYLITICVSLTFVTSGVTSTWPSPVLNKFHDNETSVDITNTQISWMLGLNPIGFIVGSLATRFLSDMMGRRATILCSAFPIAVGMFIVAFAKTGWLLLMVTLSWGIGTGILTTVKGIYLAEIADKEIRGTLNVWTRFAFNLGNLLVLVIGPFLSYDALNYSMIVLPFGYFAACWWIPESPYYYLKEGKVDAARRELVKLKCCKTEQELENLLITKQTDVNKEMEHSSTAMELFSGKRYRKALIISTGLKLTQIFTGGVTIKHYMGPILRESNIPKQYDGTVFIVFGAVVFVVGIISSSLVDRVGRRPLLIYSYFITGLCLFVIGGYFFLQEVVQLDRNSMAVFGFIPFVGIVISYVVSTIGFHSVAMIIPAEIFPMNVKAVAMTSLSVFGGVLGFIVGKYYQNVKDLVGLSGAFGIFALFSIAGGVFSCFFVPETKGKDLTEILLLLEGNGHENSIETRPIEANGKVHEEVPLVMEERKNETKDQRKEED